MRAVLRWADTARRAFPAGIQSAATVCPDCLDTQVWLCSVCRWCATAARASAPWRTGRVSCPWAPRKTACDVTAPPCVRPLTTWWWLWSSAYSRRPGGSMQRDALQTACGCGTRAGAMGSWGHRPGAGVPPPDGSAALTNMCASTEQPGQQGTPAGAWSTALAARACAPCLKGPQLPQASVASVS